MSDDLEVFLASHGILVDKKDQVDEFLEHHGVKGMHWGVHRTREDETHKQYRKQVTKQFRKATREASVRRVEKLYGKGLTEDQYKTLSTRKVKYDPGKTFNRVTKDA